MNTKAAILLLAASLSTSGLATAKSTAVGLDGSLFVAKASQIHILDAQGTRIGMISAPGRVDAIVAGRDGRLFALVGEGQTIVCYYRPGSCWDVDFVVSLPFPRARDLAEGPGGTLIVSSRAETVEIDGAGNILRRTPNRVVTAERQPASSGTPAAAKSKQKL